MDEWDAAYDGLTEAERQPLHAFMERTDGRDDDDEDYIDLRDAGCSVPQKEGERVTRAHAVEFLDWLADARSHLNRRDTWHGLLARMSPDRDPAKLIALFERVTGVTDDESFPAHLDPGRPEGAAVAEREALEQARLFEQQEQERRERRERDLERRAHLTHHLDPNEPEGAAVARRLALERARLSEQRERERRERDLDRRAYLAHRHRDTDDDADDEAEEALEASNRETALTLAHRSDDDEIPPGAKANYCEWLKRFDAYDPDAIDIYEELGAGPVNEVGITALAYRIDGTDEILILGLIFGEDFAEAVQDVMTDVYMNRWDEAPHPQNRVRSRLWAGCPAVDDATLIRMDATRCIGDADLLSLKPGTVVVADEDHVCHDSGLTIPAGERHLLADGDGTRHSLAAAWCHVVLGNVALARALQPEEPPLLLPL